MEASLEDYNITGYSEEESDWILSTPASYEPGTITRNCYLPYHGRYRLYHTKETLDDRLIIGYVGTIVYAILAVIVCWRIFVHIRYRSCIQRIAFHLILLSVCVIEVVDFYFTHWYLKHDFCWVLLHTQEIWCAHIFASSLTCFALLATMAKWSSINIQKTYLHYPIYVSFFIYLIHLTATITAMVNRLQLPIGDIESNDAFYSNLSYRTQLILTIIVDLIVTIGLMFYGFRLQYRLKSNEKVLGQLKLEERSGATVDLIKIKRSLFRVNLVLCVLCSCTIIKILVLSPLMFQSATDNYWLRNHTRFTYYLLAFIIPDTGKVLCLLYLHRNKLTKEPSITQTIAGTNTSLESPVETMLQKERNMFSLETRSSSPISHYSSYLSDASSNC